MSTFMANKANIERKWYVVDAAGKPLGKTAVIVADLLRGKGKVTYTPHADCGDNVIVINAGKAVLTGNKMEQKYYRTHSGWVGGLKETKYRILMQDKPELAMRVAVRGMMPNTVAFGVVFPGQEDCCHIADEYIDIERMMQATRIFAHAIAELASGNIA